MVDDKLRILAAMKEGWGNCLTTDFPLQGHYTTHMTPANIAVYCPADIMIECIGEMLDVDLPTLLGTAKAAGMQ